MKGSRLGTISAVASRSPEKAKDFATRHGIPHAYESYQALIHSPEVDAVYIATPHSLHPAPVIESAKAGKHILCEKPLASTLHDAREMFAAARTAGVLLMEGYMYRCHPQTKIILDIIRSGQLGNLLHIQAAFSFRAPFDPSSRIWNKKLGGGAILDVGGYPLSWARLIAGSIHGEPFQNPDSIRATGSTCSKTGVDTLATALLQFPGGLSAEISCGISAQQDNALRIYGDHAWLHVPSPYHPGHDGQAAQIYLHGSQSPNPHTIPIPTDASIYAFEADAFAQTLMNGALECPAMSAEDTLGNMAIQEAWLQALGIQHTPVL